MEIENERQKCSQERPIQAMKAVENALRDVLVVRCKSRVSSNDKARFIAEAWETFGQEWSTVHQARTLFAVAKVYDEKERFLCKCALATANCGGGAGDGGLRMRPPGATNEPARGDA